MSEQISDSHHEILDAAAKCFMKLGVNAASVDDIAHSLGSTKGRIYHHFASRGALLGAVRLQAPEFTRRAVAPVMDDNLSPSQNFHNMALTHIAAVFETLPYHKVVLQHYTGLEGKSATESDRAMEARIRDAKRGYEDLFRSVIHAGMQSGEFRCQNLSVTLHSVLILLNAPVFWYSPRPDEPQGFTAQVARQLADMGLAALI
ncbi:TetR/AcrR family transcriptional regulator [Antarcticimicrobium sediminis]|uniref:TetR/AcrR family transcriptional regulator n=1 Tax=Antarcticimicrobium sediminis TaxID=2546227 RepID=A0A4R5END0_9RHOB|nr:TetR/AcrR family transcriptional regulator [Antarcticimicrobium sediminis]TDE35943.1 TetR/AcrR family transcriptional regulator [Antarcticimicrobium sediminis]